MRPFKYLIWPRELVTQSWSAQDKIAGCISVAVVGTTRIRLFLYFILLSAGRQRASEWLRLCREFISSCNPLL